MATRVYTGFAPRGEVHIPDTVDDGEVTKTGRRVPFLRGEPVEFEPGEIQYLDEDWKTPTSKAAKAAPTPEEPSDD